MIRTAVHSDYPAIRKLAKAFWESTSYGRHGFDETHVGNLLREVQERGLLVVADQDGTIVGVLAAVIQPLLGVPHLTYATEVMYYVTPKHRQRGHGRELLQAVEHMARLRGCRYFNMVSLAWSSGAVEEHYKNRGFSRAEQVWQKEL